MSEVVEELRKQVSRVRLELEVLTVELARATEQEQTAQPGSREQLEHATERARLTAASWAHQCLLRAAVVQYHLMSGEEELKKSQKSHPNPTTAQLELVRDGYKVILKVSKQKARELVAKATSLPEALEHLEQVRKKRELRQELRQEQSLRLSM